MVQRQWLHDIGVIIGDPLDSYQQGVLEGIESECARLGFGLHVFDCNAIDHPDGSQGYKNILYSMVEPGYFDGIIYLSGSLLIYGGIETLEDLCRRFSQRAQVSVGVSLDQVPSLVVDNRHGSRALVEHLIVDHGARTIGYISGPAQNGEARERLEGYKEALAAHQIPFHHELVYFGEFEKKDGRHGVKNWLAAGHNLDAIVAADDFMIIGVLEELEAQGLEKSQLPLLAGFDDSPYSSQTNPPLTTVRQPLFELGQTAVDMINDQLNGRKVPPVSHLAVSMVLRESCGCTFERKLRSHREKNQRREVAPGVGDYDAVLQQLFHQLNLSEIQKQYDSSIAASLRLAVKVLVQWANSGREVSLESLFQGFYNNLSHGFSRTLWEDVLMAIKEALVGAGIVTAQAMEQMWYQVHLQLLRAESELLSREKLRNENLQLLLAGVGDKLINNYDHDKIRQLLELLGEEEGVECFIGHFREDSSLDRYFYNGSRDIPHLVYLEEVMPKGTFSPQFPRTFVTVLQGNREPVGIAIYTLRSVPAYHLAMMTERISSAIQGAELMGKVRRSNSQLEQLVAERTAELEAANKLLTEKSYTDQLSGLKNRFFLEDIVVPEAHRLRTSLKHLRNGTDRRQKDFDNRYLGLVILDIDHFKRVNDNYGHDVGDKVIQEVSAMVMGLVRETDPVVRYGGEEFVVVLKNLDRHYLFSIADKLRTTVAHSPIARGGGNTVRVTISIGCILFPPLAENPDVFDFRQALTLADLALLYSKETGRNRVTMVVPSSELKPWSLEAIDNLSIESLVEQNLARVHHSNPW